MRLDVGSVLLLLSGFVACVTAPKNDETLPLTNEDLAGPFFPVGNMGVCPSQCNIEYGIMVCHHADGLNMVQLARCVNNDQSLSVVELHATLDMCSCSLLDYVRLTVEKRVLTVTPTPCAKTLLDKCEPLLPDRCKNMENRGVVAGLVLEQNEPGWRKAAKRHMSWLWNKINHINSTVIRDKYRAHIIKIVRSVYWTENGLNPGMTDCIVPFMVYKDDHMGPLYGSGRRGWFPIEDYRIGIDSVAGSNWLPVHTYKNLLRDEVELKKDELAERTEAVKNNKTAQVPSVLAARNKTTFGQSKLSFEQSDNRESQAEEDDILSYEYKRKLKPNKKRLAVIIAVICLIVAICIVGIIIQVCRMGPADHDDTRVKFPTHSKSGNFLKKLSSLLCCSDKDQTLEKSAPHRVDPVFPLPVKTVVSRVQLDSKDHDGLHSTQLCYPSIDSPSKAKGRRPSSYPSSDIAAKYEPEEIKRRLSQPYSQWTSDDFALAMEQEDLKAHAIKDKSADTQGKPAAAEKFSFKELQTQTDQDLSHGRSWDREGVHRPVPLEKEMQYRKAVEGKPLMPASKTVQCTTKTGESWTQANVFDIVNEVRKQHADITDSSGPSEAVISPSSAPSTDTESEPRTVPLREDTESGFETHLPVAFVPESGTQPVETTSSVSSVIPEKNLPEVNIQVTVDLLAELDEGKADIKVSKCSGNVRVPESTKKAVTVKQEKCPSSKSEDSDEEKETKSKEAGDSKQLAQDKYKLTEGVGEESKTAGKMSSKEGKADKEGQGDEKMKDEEAEREVSDKEIRKKKKKKKHDTIEGEEDKETRTREGSHKKKKKKKKPGKEVAESLDTSQSASSINSSSSSNQVSSPDRWANDLKENLQRPYSLFSKWTKEGLYSIKSSDKQSTRPTSPCWRKMIQDRGQSRDKSKDSIQKYEDRSVTFLVDSAASSDSSSQDSIHIDTLRSPGGFVPCHSKAQPTLHPEPALNTPTFIPRLATSFPQKQKLPPAGAELPYERLRWWLGDDAECLRLQPVLSQGWDLNSWRDAFELSCGTLQPVGDGNQEETDNDRWKHWFEDGTNVFVKPDSPPKQICFRLHSDCVLENNGLSHQKDVQKASAAHCSKEPFTFTEHDFIEGSSSSGSRKRHFEPCATEGYQHTEPKRLTQICLGLHDLCENTIGRSSGRSTTEPITKYSGASKPVDNDHQSPPSFCNPSSPPLRSEKSLYDGSSSVHKSKGRIWKTTLPSSQQLSDRSPSHHEQERKSFAVTTNIADEEQAKITSPDSIIKELQNRFHEHTSRDQSPTLDSTETEKQDLFPDQEGMFSTPYFQNLIQRLKDELRRAQLGEPKAVNSTPKDSEPQDKYSKQRSDEPGDKNIIIQEKQMKQYQQQKAEDQSNHNNDNVEQLYTFRSRIADDSDDSRRRNEEKRWHEQSTRKASQNITTVDTSSPSSAKKNDGQQVFSSNHFDLDSESDTELGFSRALQILDTGSHSLLPSTSEIERFMQNVEGISPKLVSELSSQFHKIKEERNRQTRQNFLRGKVDTMSFDKDVTPQPSGQQRTVQSQMSGGLTLTSCTDFKFETPKTANLCSKSVSPRITYSSSLQTFSPTPTFSDMKNTLYNGLPSESSYSQGIIPLAPSSPVSLPVVKADSQSSHSDVSLNGAEFPT